MSPVVAWMGVRRMLNGVRGWLSGVPVSDPQERRNAVTLQVLGLAGSVWIAIAIGIGMARFGLSGVPSPFLAMAIALLLTLLGAVFLVRLGRYRAGIWLAALGLTVSPAGPLVAGGLSYASGYIRLVALPLALAALLLGRRALWTVFAIYAACLGAAALRDAGFFGASRPQPPAPSVTGLFVSTLAIYFFLSAVLDALCGSLRATLAGLSEQVLRADALSREVSADARRWRSLLKGLQLLVLVVDREGRVEYANPFFCERLGYGSGDVCGHPFTDLVPSRERRERLDAFDAAMRGELWPATLEGRVLARSGRERVVAWSSVVLRDTEGQIIGLLAVGADVSEQREAEAARDATLRQLEALRARLEEENLYLKEEIHGEQGFSGIVGQSDALKYVFLRVRQVAATDATVLVLGETGVGKELVARAIHDASLRSAAAFVRVNCAALPANVVESELFGHEPGAFTGATRLRKGRFELANGGTLFLDEVGELPLELQGKLLRVLQEGEFERVGSSQTLKTDVRVIAATNRPLKGEVAAGRFREDLFYRLNVFPITVPPLRERREDVPLLMRHFLPQLGARVGREIREVPGNVVRALTEYAWPGNVRELRNVLERAVLQSTDGVLRLPEEFAVESTGAASPATSPAPLATLEEIERLHICATLERTKGRVSGPGGAAEILGLNPNTLRSRMKKLGIQASRSWKSTPGTLPSR